MPTKVPLPGPKIDRQWQIWLAWQRCYSWRSLWWWQRANESDGPELIEGGGSDGAEDSPRLGETWLLVGVALSLLALLVTKLAERLQ
jgi:hypothetical protein